MKHKFMSIVAVLASIGIILTGCGNSDNEESSSETISTTTVTEKIENSVAESNDDSKKSNSSSNKSSYSYTQPKEEYYCMGKSDTCKNKTSDPYDFYCYSCDPDGNNIEGDQRGNKSDGYVGDNNYDGDIDTDDWEDEWNNYLNDKLDNYGY